MSDDATPAPHRVGCSFLFGLGWMVSLILKAVGWGLTLGAPAAVGRGGRMFCYSCEKRATRKTKLHLLQSGKWHQRCERCGRPLDRELRILKSETIARLQRRGVFLWEWTIHRPSRIARASHDLAPSAGSMQNRPQTSSTLASVHQCKQSRSRQQTPLQQCQTKAPLLLSATQDQPDRLDLTNRDSSLMAVDSVSCPNVSDQATASARRC